MSESSVETTKQPEALDPPLARRLDAERNLAPPKKDEDVFPFSNPQFSGRIRHLKESVESQEPMVRKIMSSIGNDMLGIRDQVLHYGEVLEEFEGSNKYVDKHDPKNTDGTDKTKSFVPRSLRKKHPVTFSNQVERDGRLSNTLTAIQAELVEVQKTHDRHKDEMAAHIKKVTELELKGRLDLMQDAYDKAIVWLAEALVEIGMTKELKLVSKTPKFLIAVAAIATAVKDFPAEHWNGLKKLSKQEPTTTFEKDAWWKALQSKCGVTYDRVKMILTQNDKATAAWVGGKLKELIPAMTTNLWEKVQDEKESKTVEGNLTLLFGRKQIDAANVELSDRMDTENGDTVRSIAAEAIKDDKKNKKKNARKKSSGGAKNQEPTPTESGQKEKKKSKKKKKSSKRPSEPYSQASSDDSSYDYEEKRRPRSRSRAPSALRNRRNNSRSPSQTVRFRSDSSHNSSNRHRNNSTSYSHSRGSQSRGRGRGRGRGFRGGSHYGGRSSRGRGRR